MTLADALPAAPSTALDEPYGEALMPRWRRPSLKTARYASPKIVALPSPAMTFARAPSSGLERRKVRYDLVALTDLPDEIRGIQVGQLQANDEVEVLGRRGAWVQVRTPLGAEGWIHRTTLQSTEPPPEPVTPVPVVVPPTLLEAALPADAAGASPTPGSTPGSIDDDIAIGAFAAAAAARERELQAVEAARSVPAIEASQVSADEAKPAARSRPRRRTPARSPLNP